MNNKPNWKLAALLLAILAPLSLTACNGDNPSTPTAGESAMNTETPSSISTTEESQEVEVVACATTDEIDWSFPEWETIEDPCDYTVRVLDILAGSIFMNEEVVDTTTLTTSLVFDVRLVEAGETSVCDGEEVSNSLVFTVVWCENEATVLVAAESMRTDMAADEATASFVFDDILQAYSDYLLLSNGFEWSEVGSACFAGIVMSDVVAEGVMTEDTAMWYVTDYYDDQLAEQFMAGYTTGCAIVDV